MFKIRKLKALTLLTVVIYTVILFLQLRQFRRHHSSMHTDGNHHFHNQTAQESAVDLNIWKFNTSQKYDARQLYAWTTPPTVVMYRGHRMVQGENGTGYHPQLHEKALVNQSFASNNFNLYASDQISLRRTLPDMRFQECRRKQYPTALPRTSIVIVVHNEPWSTLMRTIWSVVDRSPRELLQEIILVDDFSDLPHLSRPLDAYIQIFPVQLRLWRNEKREGLIRSRLVGAKLAKGSVLTFLDAHIEVNAGWLQPLLARIAMDRSVITVPQIGFIQKEQMDYKVSYATRFAPPTPANVIDFIGLRWNLQFYWTTIPEREHIRTNYDRAAPIRILTHIGCAFAVDREFFFEIGTYDDGMDIWGSENVELAFRVWQCGGSLELIPCSHIGHLFRQSIYSFGGDPNIIKWRNNVRLAEVWMDDVKKLFYAASPDHRKVSPDVVGDLSERKNLRHRLKCKGFRWLLETVFPEHSMLRKYHFVGEVRSVAENKCLDIMAVDKANVYPTQLFGCHGSGMNQFFAFAANGQIITIEERFCTGVLKDGISIGTVACSMDDESQFWQYDESKKWIKHQQTGKCIAANKNGIDVQLADCVGRGSHVQWSLKSTLV